MSCAKADNLFDTREIIEQIDDCLAKEPHPGLRLFLERLRYDSCRYRAEFVRQELEVYRHADTPDDFLTRLARLHWAWAMEGIALDTDGKWLKSGDCEMRKTVAAQLRETVKKESDPFMRLYLVRLMRQAVTDPVRAGEGLKSYVHGRHDAAWVWLARVSVAGTPEAAFQWFLAETRQKLADTRLSEHLDTIEQIAKTNLPLAVSSLESLMEKGELPVSDFPEREGCGPASDASVNEQLVMVNDAKCPPSAHPLSLFPTLWR